MRWIFTSISQPIASVNPQERYLSYPLGLAWWAAAGLKIVALSTFMATAVFAIIACLTARFSCGTLKTGVHDVHMHPSSRPEDRQLQPQKFLIFCGGLSSWEELLTRASSKARLRFQCPAKRSSSSVRKWVRRGCLSELP